MSRQSKGGKKRADNLPEEERKAIASRAAKKRWEMEQHMEPLLKATHKGELQIGDASIPCAILEDGRRVLSEFGITTALGSRSGASKRIKKARSEEGENLPVFVAPSNLQPFIENDVDRAILQPIMYKDGRRHVVGFDASVLPAVCEVWLRARDAGVLQRQQFDRAQKAEMLMRSLAKIGIVALVDEATGFQAERDRDELNRLLSIYLSEERLAWAKRFPDEFYKQIYRLRGWHWPTGRAKTPLLGKITNTIVYDRLPPGVLDQLQEKNPKSPETGRRQYKHHQFLSEEIGQPDLRDHLLQLIAIMRISSDWESFEDNFEKAFPKAGKQLSLELPRIREPKS